MTDEQLILGCVNNDRKIQQKLYDQYCKQMYSICLRYCKDGPTAADALQVAFVKVFNNISKFRKSGSLGGWIRRIVVNACLDQISFNKRNFTEELNDNVKEFSYDEDIEFDNYNYLRLIKLLDELPEGYRLIFSMYVLDEMTHEEIAADLGIKASTSRSQLLKARRKIQELIEKNQYLSLQYIMDK